MGEKAKMKVKIKGSPGSVMAALKGLSKSGAKAK